MSELDLRISAPHARRLFLLCLIGLVVGAGVPAARAHGQTDPAQIRSELIDYARDMLGVPYTWGGTTPAGFDCSGLVYYSYELAGIEVPRTAAEQLAASKPLNLSELRAGDLVFFDTTHRHSHVGIYVGHNMFIHAPSRGKDVSISTLDNPYWRDAFSYAGSFLN